MADTSFQGFGRDALPFLKALGFHQDRDWFHENKKLYESQLRKPLIAFVEETSERLGEEGIPLKGARKTSLFRINRDIRFAKEKHPYNTHASAVLTRDATKKDTGGLYIHISPDNCFLAAGFWHPSGPQLRAFREQMIARDKDFFDLERVLAAKDLVFDTDDKLLRPPNGFKHVEDGELIDRLKYKGFTVTRSLDHETVHSAKLIDTMVALGHDIMPFMQFVWRAIDPLREEEGNA